jgi:xanthine dehydrogenase accessory factor
MGKNIPDDILFNIAVNELRKGRKVALCTIVNKVGSGPRDVGSKIIVLDNGDVHGTLGGGPFERLVIEAAKEAIKQGKPKMLKYSFTGQKMKDAIDTGLICGGVITVYIDILKPVPRLVIFGTGKVGKPLADLANMLGYKVVVADPNKELVTKEMYPYAEELISGDIEAIANKLKSMINKNDIVMITHGEIETDYYMVKELITTDTPYIGLLGSRRKVVEFTKRLRNEGISEELIASKLVAPIGVDIGAETPEEIAVSIMAEIISIMHGGTLRRLNIIKEFIEKGKLK